MITKNEIMLQNAVVNVIVDITPESEVGKLPTSDRLLYLKGAMATAKNMMTEFVVEGINTGNDIKFNMLSFLNKKMQEALKQWEDGR